MRSRIADPQGQDDRVRYRIVKILGKIGPAAREGLPVLQGILRDLEDDEEILKAAAEAVERIQGPAGQDRR